MSQSEYFELVQSLAADLNKKDIHLPSFPDVVIRVRKALDDSDTTSTHLANILSVEAVLASRILILANSTYHNPGGIKIDGLEAAVGRIGFEKVRTAAIAFAVEQLHASEGLEPLKDELRATWSGGMRLAAMSEVIARHCTKLDGDSAFLAGLLNRIGVLYLFTKYHDYPTLLQDKEARATLIEEWAAPVGQSIVANWKFSEEIQETLNPDEVETTRRRTKPNLADIVTTAKRSLGGGDEDWHETDEAKRLDLTDEKLPAIMDSYKEKLDSLASAVR
ncbi:MAG: HDOD domain-containing protein [Woeseiaceae bacterium]